MKPISLSILLQIPVGMSHVLCVCNLAQNRTVRTRDKVYLITTSSPDFCWLSSQERDLNDWNILEIMIVGQGSIYFSLMEMA